MRLHDRLGAYPAHPDPVTAACNRLSLLIASSQPTYPLYVWWLVGGDWWATFWTFLSTPFFLAIPAVARRGALGGRAMLPLVGVANGIISTKAFGPVSGVEWFLLPCAVIVVLALSMRPIVALGVLAAIAGAAALHGYYGAPLGRFSAEQYRHFRSLNLYSVAILSAVIVWTLIRARRASASR